MMKKISILIILFSSINIFSQTALEVIEKADAKLRRRSSYSEITITIVKAKMAKDNDYEKAGQEGTDYSVSLVTSPAKEKGSVFLRKNEVWNYLPSLERTIKLPPSMMTQAMGTDLTNDDLVKQSSMVVDYSHKILEEEIVEV